jgi:hypothetical protein
VIQESIRKYSENSSNRMVSNIAPETFGRFNQVITNGGVALHVNLDKMSEPERETFTA